VYKNFSQKRKRKKKKRKKAWITKITQNPNLMLVHPGPNFGPQIT
jgi:hypothetical protein